uniref:Uncharacterized protein n=1 Tax=Glossina pallidipes TaxID=7398 RepID=A0A1B0A0R9_GLOPL
MSKRTKPTDWYYTETHLPFKTPKSTTRDMLETGILAGAGQRALLCRQLNFQSYPVSDADLIKKRREAEKKKVAITTSYKRDFTLHYPPLCGPREKEFIPDPLFNRRPLSGFPSTDATNFKFMDDHFAHLSENLLRGYLKCFDCSAKQRKKLSFTTTIWTEPNNSFFP